ncbi:hypothetical protein BY458DRAFT_436287 [Sporodiniella umbellata]|nr:hypothetical protein BY458DRAFT_436287 [Sporodiniella umbellata]
MITTQFTPRVGLKRDVSYHRYKVDPCQWKSEEEDVNQAMPKMPKDRFIELAQAALEQAKREEEEKGLWHELVETLIQHSGAPKVADVILEQFHSQDVIERLAEDHFIQQTQHPPGRPQPNTLKEPHQQNLHTPHTPPSSIHILVISDYLWRFFRFLLLSSLVGLVYHFMCADPVYHQSLLP